jgi:flagellar assembly factor FliW
MKLIRLEGTRFGSLEFSAEDVIRFEDGLIGFVAEKEFVLVPAKPGSPFSWLQSINNAAIAFLVADPNRFVQGYLPEISDADASKLNLSDEVEHVVLVTTNIPQGRPHEATINLAAPIVINVDEHLGRQVILTIEGLSMKYPICEEQRTATPVAA